MGEELGRSAVLLRALQEEQEQLMNILIWLQRDLRLHDNEIFHRAGQEGHHILPVFVFDETESMAFPSGLSRWSENKKAFLQECLSDLRSSLSAFGVPLLYREGDTVQVLSELFAAHSIDEVWFTDTAGTEEQQRQEKLCQKLAHRSFSGQSLLHPDDLPFKEEACPRVFTAFRKKVEKYGCYRDPLPTPSVLRPIAARFEDFLPDPSERSIHPHSAFPFRGGESAGLDRLEEWMWKEDRLREYKETRNGMLGTSYSSKFSPWIAWGCLSPKFILKEIRRYEEERISNSSTYWLLFELLWRDFFHFTWRKERGHFFKVQEEAHIRSGRSLLLWQEGRTGQDFVDAHMRELLHTGFMSNRGRQNVASYLVHALKEHWLLGAQWFEHSLIDYEVCSNYGNWTYVAGVGNDPRDHRVFNPRIQAERYDPDKRYVHTWINKE